MSQAPVSLPPPCSSRLPFLCVVLRSFALIAICFACLGVTPHARADEPMRLTRDDLLRSFGPPEAALQRGNTEMLSFPGGVRAEIRDETVVAFRGRRDTVIVSEDGSRYTLADDGTLTLKHEPEEGVKSSAAGAEAPSQVEPSEAPATESEEASSHARPSAETELDPQLTFPDSPEEAKRFLESHGLPEETEPAPAWVRPVSVAIELGVRFGIVLLILRITLAWMGRPFFFRDAAKASFLYTAVRESLHNIGELGGSWQMIHLFRADEMTSFIVLTVCIFQFGIANNGITALRIAVATKITVYVLMMAIAIAITFGLLSFS